MKLWVAPLLFLAVLALLRWSKVREDRRRFTALERERWERSRAERGVTGGPVEAAFAGIAAELDDLMALGCQKPSQQDDISNTRPRGN